MELGPDRPGPAHPYRAGGGAVDVHTAEEGVRAMNSRFKFLFAGLCCIFCGCHSQPTPQKLTKEPEPPPAYPARHEIPLDNEARESAKREISAALQSNDAITRANGVEAAQDGLRQEGSQRIVAALDDPEPIVRFAAAMAAGTLRLADAKPKLLELAEDKDPS